MICFFIKRSYYDINMILIDILVEYKRRLQDQIIEIMDSNISVNISN